MTAKPIDDTANSTRMLKHPCVQPPFSFRNESSLLSIQKTRMHDKTTMEDNKNGVQPLKETDSQLHWSTSKNGDGDNHIHDTKRNDGMTNTTHHAISHTNDLTLPQTPAIMELAPSPQQEQLLRTSFSTASTVCASNLHDTNKANSVNSSDYHGHNDHYKDKDSRPSQQQQPPTTIYVQQSQLQSQSQQTNKVHQRLMEAKRKKHMIFQICRILLQHLAHCHPQLYKRAKLLMEECVRKHHTHQVGYESLTWSIQHTFEREFPKHWNKATQFYWDSKYIPPNSGGSSSRGTSLILAPDVDNKPDHHYQTITSKKKKQENNHKFTNNLNTLSMIELENILRSIGMEDMDISHMDRQDRIRTLSYLTNKAAAAASSK